MYTIVRVFSVVNRSVDDITNLVAAYFLIVAFVLPIKEDDGWPSHTSRSMSFFYDGYLRHNGP